MYCEFWSRTRLSVVFSRNRNWAGFFLSFLTRTQNSGFGSKILDSGVWLGFWVWSWVWKATKPRLFMRYNLHAVYFKDFKTALVLGSIFWVWPEWKISGLSNSAQCRSLVVKNKNVKNLIVIPLIFAFNGAKKNVANWKCCIYRRWFKIARLKSPDNASCFTILRR